MREAAADPPPIPFYLARDARALRRGKLGLPHLLDRNAHLLRRLAGRLFEREAGVGPL